MSHTTSVDLRRGTAILVAAVAAWGIAVALLADAGVYRALDPRVIGPLIALGILVPFAVYLGVGGFQRYMAAVGLRRITAFHIWRIAAAPLFFWAGSRHLLPPGFVTEAAWGDLLAGTAALAATVLPPSRGRYLASHAVGLADFVLATALGITLTLRGDPLMAGVRSLPMAMIPLFGVGVSGACHLIAFDLLRRGAPAAATAPAHAAG